MMRVDVYYATVNDNVDTMDSPMKTFYKAS